MGDKPNIRELLNESACTHSPAKKSACNAPTPGATTGGCAFEGAQISLFPYADAAHLVHGPLTCLGTSWETRATLTSWRGRDLTRMGFTTAVTNNDVISRSADAIVATVLQTTLIVVVAVVARYLLHRAGIVRQRQFDSLRRRYAHAG